MLNRSFVNQNIFTKIYSNCQNFDRYQFSINHIFANTKYQNICKIDRLFFRMNDNAICFSNRRITIFCKNRTISTIDNRQSTIFQNFDYHKSIDSSIENSTINNSILKRQFFISKKQTFTNFSIFRRARFYQANDIFVSKRNQFTIRISRTFNYSFIIDSNVNNIVDQFDFNNQINNQFVNDNQFMNINSIIIRETLIEKTLYSTFIESIMTKTMNFVVQTIINVSMNIMFNKIK